MKVLARSWSSPAGRFVAALTAVLAVAALSVVVAPSAQATHMESQSLTPSSSGPGATASYAFEWVHGTGNAPAPVGSSYRFTFPAGFDVSGVSLGSGSISGVPFTATVDVAGQVVTLTSISQGAAVGNAIRVVLDGVVNRTAAGTAFVAVQMLTPESSLSSGGSFSTTIANGPIDRLELTDSSGNPLGPQTAGQAVDLRIRALDEFGNLVNGTGGGPDFTGTVDLTSNARAAAGLGTTAAFSGGQVVHSVTLTEATDTATLTATVSGGALAATTAAFEIAPGPAHHLQVVQSPTGARSGEVLSPALVVEVRDEFDNLVTAATGPIRVELVGSGAELSGTVEAAAVLGVATFSDLRITGARDALALRVS